MPKRQREDDGESEFQKQSKRCQNDRPPLPINAPIQTNAFEKLLSGSKEYYKKIQNKESNEKKSEGCTHTAVNNRLCNSCTSILCNNCTITCFGCAYYYCTKCSFLEFTPMGDIWKCVSCKWFR